jgi:hypothetical protein
MLHNALTNLSRRVIRSLVCSTKFSLLPLAPAKQLGSALYLHAMQMFSYSAVLQFNYKTL